MRTYTVVAFILVSVFALWAFFLSQKPPIQPSEMSGASYIGAPLKANYENKTFGFSLRMPDGFSAQELPDDAGTATVVIQNEKGEGIQILISPFEDINELTAEMIREQIPDMEVLSIEPLTVGPEHTGVAFLSDNEAFEGASREVWFVFRGNLYQISTYARLDTLLKAMFATWKFF